MKWFRRRPPAPTPAPTQSTYADLLAEYAAARARANEAEREKDRLRSLVDQIPEGRHGAWSKALGSSRRILDQETARQMLLERGLKVPMKDGAPRLEVTYVGGDR